MKEYDVVKSIKRISNKIDKYCEGTIVMVLTDPSLAYLVEFFDENDETIDVVPVKPEEVVLVYSV